MQSIQTNISFLVKYEKEMPWEISFVSPETGEPLYATVGDGGEAEAGPRFREVLQAIEKNVPGYPRYIDVQELKALGLFVENDLEVKLSGEHILRVEVGVKTHRLFKNPRVPKVKGVPTEGPVLGTQTPEEAFGNNESEPISPADASFSIQNTSSKSSSNKGSSEPNVSKSRVEIRYAEPATNKIDIPPLDDRLEEISGKIKDRVRIGDVMLIIPPLAIQVNRQSNIKKIKTLRSKSSMITQSGSAVTTITLQLYFHDLESINGRKVKFHGDRYYYMDGLRPLIAQFKKAPFVPIDHEYINDVLGIHSVALVDLTISTVPGFPHSLSATLTLAKFDHSAYMPQVQFLGQAIHYPLLRWYYQETMREHFIKKEDGTKIRNPYRTYLAPIEGQLTNQLVFQIADENQLMARKNALEYILNHRTPQEVQDTYFDLSTEYGKQVQDYKEAKMILDQYDKYQNLKKGGAIPSDVSDEKNRIWHTEPAGKKGQNLYKEIYDDKRASYNGSFFHPYESYIFVLDHPNKYFVGDGIETGLDRVDPKVGFASYIVHSDKTRSKFSPYGTPNDKAILIPMTADNVKKLRDIVEKGKEIEQNAKKEIKEYKKHQDIVRQTEMDLRLLDYPIEGLIPTSISVMYENQFSSVQVNELDSPTLQYLGCQDPYVYVSFEANEEAVQKLRELLEIADEYVHQYRIGITSGFLGVRNQLFQLFGITTVMVENVNVSTVPGYPGRFHVEITMCGFNKTQKRMEQLEGISPIYRGVTANDRTSDKWEPKIDSAIIEYRMSDMEAYPDLELPTYAELNEAIPYIDSNITLYENHTRGKYVDPDFYVSTQWTFREQIRQQREKDNRLYFRDTTGVRASTSPASTNALDIESDMSQILGNVEDKAVKIIAEWSWSGIPAGLGFMTSGSGNVTFASKEVENLVKNKREELLKIPTYNEWRELGLGSDPRYYSHWVEMVKKGSYPSEVEVYAKIYELVDKHWVSKGMAYNDKKVRSQAWQKVTYASANEFNQAYYEYLYKKSPASTSNNKSSKALSASDLKTTNYKIPRERLANLIKALLHVQSSWSQFFSNGKPRLNYAGNQAGIAGVPLNRVAKTAKEAKRLLWDWEYNLEVAVKLLSQYYQQAAKSSSSNLKSKPWDWMIHAYETGKLEGRFGMLHAITISRFHSWYNSFEYFYATPYHRLNPDIVQYRDGHSSRERILYDMSSPEHREAIIEDLLNAGYRGSPFRSKEEAREYLEGLSNEKLLETYEDFFERTSPTRRGGLIGGIPSEEEKRFKLYQSVQKKREEIQNKLVNSDDPQTLFYEMFTDMILYDQRGRLLRAFPTFYMFIVDEGRWLGSYRLWDNLYGFNAIQSIDIHKSRKVAADTAVITMTNVYSNLTTIPADARKNGPEIDFWNNILFQKDNKRILEERKELLTTMFLIPGARIHLRMGYGSSVPDLPIVFNGTITEMTTEEVITIVAQGDGIELTNVISGDPDDNNNGILHVTEPRDLICELLTSKGNWLKDVINKVSDNGFFKDNPLGIMHFGTPGETPPGNIFFFNENYGEAAQNIYSSSGIPTYSQWVYQDGSPILPFSYESTHWDWGGLAPGDEPNIIVPFYNNTLWDIAQTIAYCTPDYIAAVHPFELRSTLFFGKPYWKIAWRYDSYYEYDEKNKQWIRYLTSEHRKPFMQFHYYDSNMDIISNKIKASEEGVYTVVIVNYDGKQTMPYYADYDIRFDKQKLAVVDAQIISRAPGLNFWTAEKQAEYYGCSTLRDYMKDIYKGELLVLGDPSLKPYDYCYLNDSVSTMTGGFQVKAVTHHFSFETGFVSSIQPDMLAVIDDTAQMNIFNWLSAFGFNLGIYMVASSFVSRQMRKLFNKSMDYKRYLTGKGKAVSKKIGDSVLKGLIGHLEIDDKTFDDFKDKFNKYVSLEDNDPRKAAAEKEMEEAFEKLKAKVKQIEKSGSKAIEKINAKSVANFIQGFKAIRSGGKDAVKAAMSTISLAAKARPILMSNIITGAATVLTEGLFEMYRRYKASFQAVLVFPMRYRGREFSAGITGHKGMVVGDTEMGAVDSLLSGLGFNGKEDGNLLELFFDVLNFLTGDDKKFTTSYEDLR